MKKKITLFFLFITPFLQAQITGLVTTKNNEPLPFVSIYLQNSYKGTTSNDEGNYELNIQKAGNYTILFQSLGYKTVKKKVQISSLPIILNIVLNEDAVSLNEVEISSKENPAYKIIRKTIENKKRNLLKTTDFTADFYSRGIYRIKNAPEKILGFELGDLGGGLDSTRSGVLYLSETISKITKNATKFKERIIASKVSGDDNGFSFNQASEVNFNFYNNLVELGENIVSPISSYAFNYYKYHLESSFYEENHLINKIKISPKRTTDNAFEGYIYIVESSWEIYAVELSISGKQIQQPAVDKLHLKQNYLYSIKNNSWSLFSQSIDFKFGMFGINIDGRFTAVYRNYNFNPLFTPKTFTKEVLSFEDKANKKDTLFWNEIRPVPLTKEEISDYTLKDSIKIVRKSKKYLDSVDVKKNKFNIDDLIFGYTYKNSHKNWNLNIGSPILGTQFNTVQGWHNNMDLSFFKNYKEKNQRLWVNAILDYGLSDKRFRPSAKITYQFNNKTKPVLAISGGNKIAQFNQTEPISPLLNSITSLFFEQNYAKFYDKTFANVSFAKEVLNGVRVFSSIAYENRKPVFNTTDYVTLNKKNEIYTSNNPLETANYTTTVYEKNEIYKFSVGTTIRFGQEYISYPDRKVNLWGNKYPKINLNYTKGFSSSDTKYNYDLVQTRVFQNFEIGNKGRFSYNIKAGKFLTTDELSFVDYKHFNGNQTSINLESNYTNSFYLLPYYNLSTNTKYAEFHVQHQFNGYILRKIPLLNKLQFKLVLSANALLTPENTPYTEYAIGLDNIGLGKFRFLRVDYVRSNLNGIINNGFVFGISF
jgi:Family of unknown function (DUF5686)/CarboxypepD_reg-like domain